MKTILATTALATALLSALAQPAFAQQHAHASHDHAAMQAQADDEDKAEDDTDAQAEAASTDDKQHDASQHAAMGHAGMDHAATSDATAQPRMPIPQVTDADRAAAFPPTHTHTHASSINRYVLVDRLEGWDRDGSGGQAWEASAWIGGDIDRLWLRSEGEREDGRTHAADLEALYGHAISPWWDLLAGVRQQLRPDGSSWAAFGVQGLAPYKFETSAMFYLGERGEALLKLEAEYEVLLSNRLILQPRIETTFALDRDSAEHSDGDSLEAGLRLRYEISRRFAPYVGWEHERRFGDGADVARAHGESVRESRFVAGVRVWF
ncbi:MAG: copper resistance protein B [Pseudomonas sp.]